DRPVAPGVEAASGDSEGLTHQSHGPDILVGLDKGEDHRASKALKAVAFFKMSRSIWRRRFSALRRRISSSRVLSLPLPGKAWSPSCSRACFQERSRVSCRPSDRAASATE